MNKLIIEDDEGKTTIVPLIRDEITIGRKEGNTIRLTERNVSRRHAKLTKTNGRIFLEDLGSYNGIKVNGSKIDDRTTIGEGDRIQIGDYVLALKVDAQAEKKADPFDEMKTIPMEREEVEANIQEHEAAAAAESPPSPQPAQQSAQPQAEPAAAQPAKSPAPAGADGAAEKETRPDLAEEAAVEGPFGRLVILSNPLRGSEYKLDKKGMVIGRWPENDIVVDHASISRNHAKIVNEDGRYSIVDMGSQNGVLVNGDKYDRVELRKGDMIDLGHVRFRFVAPGEDFDVERDVDWEEGKSKVGIYVTVGLLAVAGVLAVMFLWPSDEKKGPPDQEGQTTSGKVASRQGGDGGESPRVVSLDRSKIKNALAAKDWEKAIEEAKSFLKRHPNDAEAQRLMEKARQEKKNEKRYKKFLSHWKKRRYLAAAKLGKNFPEESAYHSDVSSIWPQAVKRYADPLLKKAKSLARREKCSELRALSRKVTDLNPEETRFQTLIDNCGKQVADSTSARPRRGNESRTSRSGSSDTTSSRAGRKPSRPRTAPDSSGGKSGAQLTKEARAAFANNQYNKAYRLARKAYRKKPSGSLVLIIGLSACRTSRPRTAKWAYRRLSGSGKRAVAAACRSRGLKVQ
jgi:pSer/pThr/pTyr-binding forkhead associated (FHA) protein